MIQRSAVVSQFIEGVYSITGVAWIMDLTGETPHPSGVGMIAGLLVIMGLSVLSAASGVGRGIKILSDLNLVLSLILLGVFVVFGSFFFALSTYGSALIDYILHLPQLSFLAYSPESLASYTAALPEAARPLADQLYAGATNAWGSAESFRAGLTGAAAEFPPKPWTRPMPSAPKAACSAGSRAGRPSTGHGGSPSRPSSACSSPASRAAGPSASSSLARWCCHRWSALPG